jgi:prepilin-type N-terminal cleavage/methylation domain-containing protein
MNPRSQSAFTLVELLVVIAIIAMLAGLLLPAVQYAREAGRRATCMNNQHQLSLAIQHYESAKQRLPGYINRLTVPSYASAGLPQPPTAAAVSWFAVLLPYLERNDLWEGNENVSPAMHGWRTGLPSSTVPPGSVYVRVALAVCPDDSTTAPCALSYVVNLGSALFVFPNYFDPVNETGVFRNLVPTRIGAAPATVPRPISLSDIKSKSQRPMLSERTYPMDLPAAMPPDFGDNDKYMRRWSFNRSTPVSPPSFAATELVDTSLNVYLSPERFGFIWPPTPTTSPLRAPFLPPAWLPQNTIHPGIVIVTFCDGHTESLAENANCADFDCTPVQ